MLAVKLVARLQRSTAIAEAPDGICRRCAEVILHAFKKHFACEVFFLLKLNGRNLLVKSFKDNVDQLIRNIIKRFKKHIAKLVPRGRDLEPTKVDRHYCRRL